MPRVSLPLLLAGLAWASPLWAQTLVPNDLTRTTLATGLSAPTAAEYLPDGRLVIIQQGGGIRVRPAAGGRLINAGTISVDRGHPERGLLGLAVDPQFATTNRLYFYFSAPSSPSNDRNRVGWATIDPATSMVDVGNVQVIVRGIFGPANHNGGGITFGPDGNLYIGTGDTGCNCACSPGTATNYFPTCLTNANGKILRVDRDGNIPMTNPLRGVTAVPACGANPRPAGSRTDGCNAPLYQSQVGTPREDIYAWGFRNPWRFSFDEQTGFLWIGDVGEVTAEEITISRGPGEHHGWPFREGAAGQPVATCQTATPQSTGPCVEPAFAYPHAGGAASVSGGIFSNSCIWPASYSGRYWFSDYDQDLRTVWTLQPNAARDGVVSGSRQTIISNAAGVVHFFRTPSGAIGMVNINQGEVWDVAPTTPEPCVVADAGFPPDAVSLDAVGMDAPPAPDALPAPDAAGPLPDTGLFADAGAAPDAAEGPDLVVAADAVVSLDAGVQGDSAPATDAGSDPNAKKGCGCDAGGGSGSDAPLGTIALGVLLVVGARRRAQRNP